MLREHGLDDPPLDANAAAVDQADFGETALVRFPEVFVDNGGHVARSERVQIEGVLDRDANRRRIRDAPVVVRVGRHR